MKDKPTADEYLLHKLEPSIKKAIEYARTDASDTNESTMAWCFDELEDSIDKLPCLFPNSSIERILNEITSTIVGIKTCISLENSPSPDVSLNMYHRIVDMPKYLRLKEKYINLLNQLAYHFLNL